MVQCVTRTVSELTIREAIVRKLKSEMKDRKFLLVLDDVWNEDADLWDCMKKCLQEIGGLRGSRILVTTRYEKVLSIMQTSSIHLLGRLSDNDSKILLEKIAFGRDVATRTSQLVNICERIAEKCHGVPLALKAIGGVMNSNKVKREWSKIEKSELWLSLDTEERVFSAIKLSFNYLPSFLLKQCFAYCSLIRKSCIMDRDFLIQLWMAQGLIHPSKESQLDAEDIGSNYFNILLQRSLLQDARKNDYGDIVSCKMHDLVHDFVLKASGDKCLIMTDESINSDIKTLHLVVISSQIQKLKISEESLSRLRTLALYVSLPSNVLEDVLANSKHLRVLTLADKGIKDLPRSIAKLKHLRYLNICPTSIVKLSSSITKLYNLQTLILNYLQKLPSNLKNMVSLRNLQMGGEQHDKKLCSLPGIGQLSSLQTLGLFVVRDDRDNECKLDELGDLNNLKGHLELFGLQNVRNKEEAAKANLSRKNNLDDILLHWDGDHARNNRNEMEVLEALQPPSSLKSLTVSNFRGQNLPSWMSITSRPLPLQNLVKINLENFTKCKQIPCLGQLPNLKKVKISEMDGVKCIGSEFYGWMNPNPASCRQNQGIFSAFLSLEKLTIKGMADLEEWLGVDCLGDQYQYSSVKVFPCLEVLKVENCPNLNSLPNGIWRNLVSLQCLFIEDCDHLSHLPEDLQGLESLHKLKVLGCPNVVSFPTISNLKHLRHLQIRECHKLRTLPRGIEVCTSLDLLSLYQCPALNPEDLNRLSAIRLKVLYFGSLSPEMDYFPLPSCTSTATGNRPQVQHALFFSLETLAVSGWPTFSCLPKEIVQFSTLQYLEVACFDRIVDLPQWLCNLNSLQTLRLHLCKKLVILPPAGALRRLDKLTKLQIDQCPLLEENCKKGCGSEWHKISHIPTSLINDERIQDQS